jgi:hypothetical protein
MSTCTGWMSFFRLENFDRGLRVYADLFERLSEQWDSMSFA